MSLSALLRRYDPVQVLDLPILVSVVAGVVAVIMLMVTA